MKLIEPTRASRPSASSSCALAKVALLERPEQVGALERRAPGVAAVGRGVAAVGGDAAPRSPG